MTSYHIVIFICNYTWITGILSRRMKFNDKFTCSIVKLGKLLITLKDLFNVRLHNVDDLVYLRLRRLQSLLRGDLLRRPGPTNNSIGSCTCTCASTRGIRRQTAFRRPEKYYLSFIHLYLSNHLSIYYSYILQNRFHPFIYLIHIFIYILQYSSYLLIHLTIHP